MQLREIDILTLLPQRPPFIMIDQIVYYDELITRTEFLINNDNIFCHNGRLLPAGIIENIAQTCAARIGYINRTKNEEVKIGVIGSVQNLKIFSPPLPGYLLETEIIVSNIIFSVTIVEAFVKCRGEMIAQCSMKIAIIDGNNEKD